MRYRANAALVRPRGDVAEVNGRLDPDLDRRIAEYAIDYETGLTNFYEGVGRVGKHGDDDDYGPSLKDADRLEQTYSKLYDANFRER
ncbi:unnamed protein product [Ectocarpus sp. 4 AP-2014]